MGLQAHRLAGAALLLAALHLALAQCPEVTSVFDLPAIHKCKGALEKLWEQPGCSGAAAEAADRPPAACCGPALEFMGAKCDCWRTFDSSTLAGVQDLVARCPPPQLPAAAAGGGGQGQGSKAVAAATTEQQHPVQQQPRQQQQPFKIYVGVLSASKKRAARDAIRAGWATSPLLHLVRFFLARSPNDTLFDEVRWGTRGAGSCLPAAACNAPLAAPRRWVLVHAFRAQRRLQLCATFIPQTSRRCGARRWRTATWWCCRWWLSTTTTSPTKRWRSCAWRRPTPRLPTCSRWVGREEEGGQAHAHCCGVEAR